MSQAQLIERDKQREAEWRQVCGDFLYFFITYWTVTLPSSGKMRPEVREAQCDIARRLQSGESIICVKARQIGYSTIMAAYAFWVSFTQDSAPVLLLSRREDPEAKELLAKVKLGYYDLPLWMRQRGPRLLKDNSSRMDWSSGSYIYSDASKDDPARGGTYKVIIMDEFGKFQNPYEAEQSAMPAAEWGQVVILGNANGYGTHYHTMYLKAKAGESKLKPLFYGWRAGGPHRDDDWFKRQTSGMEKPQIAAEYPEDDVECWVQAGAPRFDNLFLSKLPTKEGMQCRLQGFQLVRDDAGLVKVFEQFQEGHKYVVGVDVAGGGEGGDYGVGQVVDIITKEQVAVLRGRIDPSHLAFEVMKLATHYGEALVVPELNNHGYAFIRALRDDYRYRKVFRERKWGAVGAQSQSMRYGFYTDRSKKSMGIDRMWKRIQDAELIINDKETMTELMAFKYITPVEMGGEPHDDRVMSLMLAAVGMDYVNIPAPVVPVEPKVEYPVDQVVSDDGVIFKQSFRSYVDGDPTPGKSSHRKTRTLTLAGNRFR